MAVDQHPPAEFANAARDHEITWWPIRDCSICGVPVGYEFTGDTVAFSSGCGCNSLGGLEPRTWADVSAHYNMQTHPAVIERYDRFWHFAE